MKRTLRNVSFGIVVCMLNLLSPKVSHGQSGNNCNTIANLTCGQTISSTTVGGGNDFTAPSYTCHSSANPFDAEDKVYKIVPTLTGIHEITLSGLARDLDLFLFSTSCTAGTCIAKSTAGQTGIDKISIHLTSGVSYYIVVDGYNATQTSAFNLTLTCPVLPVCASDITELMCGRVDTFTTVGRSSQYAKSNFTSCMSITNSTFSGGDKVFKYKHNSNNPNAVFSIWGYTKDLDLFVFNTCYTNANCIKAAKNKQDKHEYLDFTGLSYGDYYIVVDGYDATQVSQFLVSINCQQICKPSGISIPISCGQTLSGTTVDGGYSFSKYSCDPSYEFTGPEKYYAFKAPTTDTFVLELFDFAHDLELFVTEPLNCKLNPICKASSLNPSGHPEKIKIPMLKDESINIVVDGSLGDRGSFKLKLSCPAVNRCAEAEAITCGTRYDRTTLNAGNEFTKSDYTQCHVTNALYTGNDNVFKYTHTANAKNAQVVIWGYTTDLDLFLFNSCQSNASCVDCSAHLTRKYEVIDFTNKPFGDYYIVVDGATPNQNGNFSISVSCQYSCTDALPESITCNSSVQGNTSNGMNRYSKYSCFSESQFTGNEKIYRFKAAQSGEHTIDLTGFNNDLELFVLENANCTYSPICKAKSTNAPGQTEQIKINLLQNESIDIVVDGALGAHGSFILKVTCPVVQPIEFDVSDEVCDLAGKTIDIPVRVKGFKNVTSFSMTIKSGNSNVVQLKSIQSIVLTGVSYFVHEVNKTITITFLSNTPITLADGQAAFSIEAVLAGTSGQTASIQIIDSPTMIKAVVTENNLNSLYPVVVKDGSVCILSPPPPATLKFDIDEVNCESKGASIQIPVRVKAFKNIRSFSMTVTVDNNSILELNSISSSLSGLTSFESTPKKTFTIGMLSNTGITLPDASIVYYINATLVGNPGQIANLSIVATPTNIQAIAFENNLNITVPVEVMGGTACVNAVSVVNCSGKVVNRSNLGIKSALVKLRGSDSVDVVTPDNGSFTANNLLSTGQYTLSATKNTNARNGIDLLDLAALQDHIITRTVLTDPYKLLAADLNRDGVIDILDLAELQDLIITRINSFTNNTSWICIPTDEVLTASKVFNKTYRTQRDITTPANNLINQDFYGIKIGDLDQSANTQNVTRPDENVTMPLKPRSTGSFSVMMPSMKAKKDQIIYVPLVMEKFSDVRVFQFVITWDATKLEYLQAESFNSQLPGFDASNMVYNPQQPGVINSLWLNPNNNSLPDNAPLMVMVFKVKGNMGDVVELAFKDVKALEVSGSLPAIQSTNSTITVSDITSAWRKSTLPALKINAYPNPTTDQIRLSADSAFDAIELIDATGKVYPLHLKGKSNYVLGLQTYPSGVYVLKMKTGNGITTSRIVLSN